MKAAPQDLDRINIQEDSEVQYWTKRFGVTPEELKKSRGSGQGRGSRGEAIKSSGSHQEELTRSTKGGHFVAYLRSQQREDRQYDRLAEFYRKMAKDRVPCLNSTAPLYVLNSGKTGV